MPFAPPNCGTRPKHLSSSLDVWSAKGAMNSKPSSADARRQFSSVVEVVSMKLNAKLR